MGWKNRAALAAEYEDPAFQGKFAEIFAIRQFIRYGIRSPRFALPGNASEGLSFTADGELALDGLIKRRTDISENEARFAVFVTLYRENLLVDVNNTDTSNLKLMLGKDVVAGEIRYPWVFDHLLYDRAFAQLGDIRDQLDVRETQDLLTDTPPGVFQLGTFVVGPLGLLVSSQKRLFRPHFDLLLSHCADPACNHAHVARLSQPDRKLDSLVSDVQSVLKQKYSALSEWWNFGSSLLDGHDWYDDFSLTNLPWLLGNCFSEREIRVATAEFIRRGRGDLRSKMPRDGPTGAKFRGSAVDVASRLSKPEALQILQLGSDAELVEVFDHLIEQKIIVIPVSEIREAPMSAPSGSWAGAKSQCSSLGLRVVGTIKLEPLARLRRLMLELYASDQDKQQLAWMLGRGVALGNTVSNGMGQELERFILNRTPSSTLEELVFSNHDKLRKALQFVRAPHLTLPRDRSEDRHLIDCLLWRLGFPVIRFESNLQSFRQRLDQFKAAACGVVSDSEEWKAQVRGAAANLFPLTEEILDGALAFSSWIFLSDHYVERHTYNLRRARLLMASELSGIISTEEGPVKLDASGGNTLFPLIVGFLALRQRLADLLQNPDRYLKLEVLMAHYYHETSLEIFPYKHKYFVLDAVQKEVTSSMKLFQQLGSSLQQPSVLAVRNGIVHPKLRFPDRAQMIEFAETVSTTIDFLEEAGFIPVIYATVGVQLDSFGRMRITSADYAQHSITWHPSPALGTIRSLPSHSKPQILVRSLHLPQTDEILRFKIEEDSDYTEMWKDYPKRRQPTEKEVMAITAAAVDADSSSAAVHEVKGHSAPNSASEESQ